MNAVVTTKAEVGEEAVVAALAFVKAEQKIPPALPPGFPHAGLRGSREQELRWKKDNMHLYQDLARRSAATMQKSRRSPRSSRIASALIFGRRALSELRQQSMSYQFLTLEHKRRVAVITLNRPKQLNALSPQLMDELGSALKACDADEGVGAIVITGNEKAFAAGADIGAMKDFSYMDAFMGDYITAWEHFRSVRKPVIAAVSGYALGGGNELAMQFDIVIAADNAKFGQPEINLGIMPGYGGTQRLPRFTSKAKAMDLCLTARMMDAQEAERAGLVSRVVPLEKSWRKAGRRRKDRRYSFPW